MTEKVVEELILDALASLNQELEEGEQVTVSADTVLFGAAAQIDSLSLVSLIVDIETALNVDHGLNVCLTDDRAMSREVSPFTDVGALKQFILEIANSK